MSPIQITLTQSAHDRMPQVGELFRQFEKSYQIIFVGEHYLDQQRDDELWVVDVQVIPISKYEHFCRSRVGQAILSYGYTLEEIEEYCNGKCNGSGTFIAMDGQLLTTAQVVTLVINLEMFSE